LKDNRKNEKTAPAEINIKPGISRQWKVITRTLLLLFIALVIFKFNFVKKRLERPNIIMIVVDTLRPDHLGAYGYKKSTSPNVDTFARDGIVYKNCFAHSPTTGPSVSSIMSGFLPHETTVVYNSYKLPFEVKTLAEYLKESGYNTYAVISNYMLRMKKRHFQGFDVYDDEMLQMESVRPFPERIAEHTTNRAIELLKEQKSKDGKFFMWLHYQDPHGPYTPPTPYKDMFFSKDDFSVSLPFTKMNFGHNVIAQYQQLGNHKESAYYISQYDGEIRYFDDEFKRLIDAIKAEGFYDDSMIIFTSDHGEGMGEHGLYFLHEDYMYDTLLRVPLIIKYDDKRAVRTENVQHIDLMPTIFSVTGIPSKAPLRGVNILKDDIKSREIFSEYSIRQEEGIKDKDTFSLIEDNMKIVFDTARILMFDLKNDPAEDHDLSALPEYSEMKNDMAKRLFKIREESLLNIDAEYIKPVYTEEEMENLRSLGYLN